MEWDERWEGASRGKVICIPMADSCGCMAETNTILLVTKASILLLKIKENTLERINTISEAEKWISELEDGMVEITEIEHDKEKIIKRNEDSLRDLQHNSKHYTYSNNI